MNKDFDALLCKEFPNLYADRHADMRSTAMCWGFCTGDGWNNIIYDLSRKLEAMILALPESARGEYKAAQIKEKFGTLRFYMWTETDEMHKVIREAEALSAVTCETCGNSGAIADDKGWLIATCGKHEDLK